jgi:hypothetical protein
LGNLLGRDQVGDIGKDGDNVRMDLKEMALEDAAVLIKLSSSGTQL